MSRQSMSHINQSYHTQKRVMSRKGMCHATWLMSMCDMTHVYVWHDSCLCVKGLMSRCDMCDMTQRSETSATPRKTPQSTKYFVMNMCTMTHFYAWHGSSACETWLNAKRPRQRNSTHSSQQYICIVIFHVWHDSFLCVTSLQKSKVRDLGNRRHQIQQDISCVARIISMRDMTK